MKHNYYNNISKYNHEIGESEQCSNVPVVEVDFVDWAWLHYNFNSIFKTPVSGTCIHCQYYCSDSLIGKLERILTTQ